MVIDSVETVKYTTLASNHFKPGVGAMFGENFTSSFDTLTLGTPISALRSQHICSLVKPLLWTCLWMCCYFEVSMLLDVWLACWFFWYVNVLLFWSWMLWNAYLPLWFEGLSVGLAILICECVVILRLNVARCVVSLLVWGFKCCIGSFGLWMCCWFVQNYVHLLILVNWSCWKFQDLVLVWCTWAYYCILYCCCCCHRHRRLPIMFVL
jgi:hypothetical protein